MDAERFEQLVAEALDGLPEQIRHWLDNVEVVIEDWPSRRQLGALGAEQGTTLFGLYEGVPLTVRSSSYGLVLPDKITIFRGPITRYCFNEAQIRQQVQRTVVHEIAHHFGLDDDRLDELGY
jgi:predicted Zn-dependent protease with MMP-like domain